MKLHLIAIAAIFVKINNFKALWYKKLKKTLEEIVAKTKILHYIDYIKSKIHIQPGQYKREQKLKKKIKYQVQASMK